MLFNYLIVTGWCDRCETSSFIKYIVFIYGTCNTLGKKALITVNNIINVKTVFIFLTYNFYWHGSKFTYPQGTLQDFKINVRSWYDCDDIKVAVVRMGACSNRFRVHSVQWYRSPLSVITLILPILTKSSVKMVIYERITRFWQNN